MRSVEDVIRRVLGLDRDEGLLPLWRLLEAAEADPYAVDWIRRFERDIIGAWSQCPRADWLVMIAVHLKIERERVSEAVKASLDEAELIAGRRIRSMKEVGEIAEAWRSGATPHERLLAALRWCIDEAIEMDPDLEDAERLARRYRVVGPFNDAYHVAHQRLADRIRDHISIELIEASYLGQDHGPYR